MNRRLALLALIIANVYPLCGLLFWHWKPGNLLIAYWIDNVATGLWTLPKIATARGTGTSNSAKAVPKSVQTAQRIFLVPFFCVHYGGFTLVHGLFAFALARYIGTSGNSGQWLGMFVVACASHGISYVVNWVDGGERDRINPMQAMFQPYGRVMAMHLTVLLGGGLLAIFTDSRGPAYLLLAIKFAMDLGFYRLSHRRPNEAPASGEALT